MTAPVEPQEIIFERKGEAGVVTLNRPKALNAVTHRMVLALSQALKEWESDDAVAAVVVRAEGRAFSAGGDIMDIYRAGLAGKPPVQFFADEYRLNAGIRRFPKPYVSLIDGIVMGGGVGVSFHGSHRVLGEKALFATAAASNPRLSQPNSAASVAVMPGATQLTRMPLGPHSADITLVSICRPALAAE